MHGCARTAIIISRRDGRICQIGANVTMAFVVVSRTALVTPPIILAVFAITHLRWKPNVLLFFAAIASARWPGRYRPSAGDDR